MQTKLALKTKFRTTPQLVMFSKLLQVPSADLERFIASELSRNPALDFKDQDSPTRSGDAPVYQSGSSSTGMPPIQSSKGMTGSNETQHDPVARLAYRPTALEQLLAEARLMVDQEDYDLIENLIYSLDEQGYLRTPFEELAETLNVSQSTIERLARVIRQLDPLGIGARNLRECLLMQCRHLASAGVECGLVIRILQEAWNDFCAQRFARAARKIGAEQAAIDEVASFICRHLHPCPMDLIDDQRDAVAHFTYPDIVISQGEGGTVLSVALPQSDRYALQISHSFEDALKAGHTPELTEKDGRWTRKHVGNARLFIEALEQRWATLRQIAEYLVHHQRQFLLRGALYLRPLTRAAVATELGYHESTISRAVHGKVVLLPSGRLIALSDFFDSSAAPKEAIRQVLAESEVTLSDREIVERLHAGGLKLSRRTVAKYRRQLGIPSSYQRANINGVR